MELGFKKSGANLIGFRPCQWLLDYHWSELQSRRPLRLTGSVCYDATDLDLSATLRRLTDVFIIPAFNKDVATFDRMAHALHYHMFQLVVVANNGEFGGSNAYLPRGETEYQRQLFHLHGQPQASIAFFEIDDIPDFIDRRSHPSALWKSRPAGLGVVRRDFQE